MSIVEDGKESNIWTNKNVTQLHIVLAFNRSLILHYKENKRRRIICIRCLQGEFYC